MTPTPPEGKSNSLIEHIMNGWGPESVRVVVGDSEDSFTVSSLGSYLDQLNFAKYCSDQRTPLYSSPSDFCFALLAISACAVLSERLLPVVSGQRTSSPSILLLA